MQKFYITFGQVHAHAINGKTFDKDCVCEIQAENETKARNKAFDAFGAKWAFISAGKPKKMNYYPRGIIKLEN